MMASRAETGPMDNMGNIICSLESMKDFPPLDQYSDEDIRFTRSVRLDQGREDISTEELIEDTSSYSEGDSGSPNNSYFMNISFQEALNRERAPNKRKNDILNLVTLRKMESTDSRNQKPSKKVSEEDSGWWKITGKKVVPENQKSEKN